MSVQIFGEFYASRFRHIVSCHNVHTQGSTALLEWFYALEAESYCDSYYGKDEGSKCFRDDDDNEVTKTNSCNADNLILNWKELFYSSINATSYGQYTYLNSAARSNESCPVGKQKCGILDELGNILCLPIYENCFIGLLVRDSSQGRFKDNLIRQNVIQFYLSKDCLNQKKYIIKLNDVQGRHEVADYCSVF